MIDLNQYVKDATRTESKIDTFTANGHLFAGVVEGMIALGNILDMIKKNTFYGKEIDLEKLSTLRDQVELSLIKLDPAFTEEPKMEFSSESPRVFHAIVGIATEATEMLEALQRSIVEQQPIDAVNICEELGDNNWYQAILVDALEADFEKIFEVNIAKLRQRFPEKFTSEDAINRDLDTERKILEGK